MQFFSQLSSEMQIFLTVLLALVMGSFCSLLSYRIFTKDKIIMTRSKCTNCGAILGILNLIPLFSYIFQRGKCDKCQGKISLRYPLIELAFLISFLVVYFVCKPQFDYKFLLYLAITSTLIFMAVVDLEHYLIPNAAQYVLAILATLLVIVDGGTSAALINVKAAFLYALFGGALWAFFYFVAHIDALGIDDIKFFFIAGLMLGTKDFLSFMILSGVFGIVFGSTWQKMKNDETFPFAPALCLAAFTCMLFDKKINAVDLMGSLLFFQGF